MKAITAYTDEEYAIQSERCKNLFTVVEGTSSRDWFDDYRRQSGYAHYKFSGRISDKLVELLGRMPTGDELIMLIDKGFSHFGASCSINGSDFSGRVNID